MKRILKFILEIMAILILCVIIDLISIYTRSKPIFAIEGAVPYIYKGLFYDTYNCAEYSVPQIKMKSSKFICGDAIDIVEQYAYTIETTEVLECNQNKVLYMGIENKNIYTYCLDSIKINDGNKLIELRDYYSENDKVFEELVNTLDYIDTYKDGGSKLYRDNGDTDFTNNGLAVIWCDTLDGNQDIYIGSKDMEYEIDFCEYDNNMKEFLDE